MRIALALVIATGLCGCATHRVDSPAASILPLRTLRLYETGVGYFERTGVVAPSGEMALPVPSGHLDDALKTLVVLGKHGERGAPRVDGVQFGSSVSRAMARAMAGLPQDADSPIAYRDLLVSLKGAAVEVTVGGRHLRGRLIDVLGQEPAVTLTLLLESAELQRLDAKQVSAIRALDPAYAQRLAAGLDALSTRGAQSRRMMHVLASAAGPVTLGYIAETPVWRTTYRLVLDDKAPATLQGWALVHNDTDEDWQRVGVDLVNGRPDSFLFPLAAPRYARRELAHPDAELSTVPQLVDQTADMIWGDHLDSVYGAGGLGITGTGSGGGGGSGEGHGLGSIGTIGHGSGVGESSVIGVDSLAETAEAKGVEAGALFSYHLAEPLELRAHSSALVPFVQRPITAESIVWFDGPDAEARSAVRVVNTTQQTLPTGTVAIFGSGGFAGEAALDRLKPGEKRIIEHGAELDVELHHTQLRREESLKRVTWDKERVTEHYLQTTEESYELENRGGQMRVAWVKLPVVARAQVTGPDRQELDAAKGALVAGFQLAARDKRTAKLVAVEPLRRPHAFGDLDAAWLEKAIASTALDAADRRILTEALQKRRAFELLLAQLESAKHDLGALDADLERLREHCKAIGEKGAAGVLVNRIVANEDRRNALARRIEGLGQQEATQRASLRSVFSRLQPAHQP